MASSPRLPTSPRAAPPDRARSAQWRSMEAAVTAALESFSPIDGRRLGAVPTLAPEQVQAVVDDVAEVQPFWAALPARPTARATCAAPPR